MDTSEVLDDSWFSLDDQQAKTSSAQDAPASQGEIKASFGVHVQPGDRFPLQKTVKKTLTLSSPQGPIENNEEIELMMSVVVEEVREQNKKFRILYNRVKYSSNLNGQRQTYDSSAPPATIPDQALAYHGMVNNGFSFWVGPDNKITDVVDFNEFLNRCLQHVPAHKADAIAEVLNNYSSQQDGIANFVDDTIGLLPYDPKSQDGSSTIRLGGNWSKSRHFNDPVPMSLNNTYTLKELNDEYAKVEVMGRITPAAGVSNPSQDIALQIKDGQSAGTCTIDRKTGLPLDSYIDHQMNMVVELNGIPFEQSKRVVTTVRMFLEQKRGEVQQITAESNGPTVHNHEVHGVTVRPVNHETMVR